MSDKTASEAPMTFYATDSEGNLVETSRRYSDFHGKAYETKEEALYHSMRMLHYDVEFCRKMVDRAEQQLRRINIALWKLTQPSYPETVKFPERKEPHDYTQPNWDKPVSFNNTKSKEW